jgi:hypothetical protein
MTRNDWRCRLGIHTAIRSQGNVGYCLRGCGNLRRHWTNGSTWQRYVDPPAAIRLRPGGLPDREPSIIKQGGYQGSSDPGRPTQLMQQQTQPTPLHSVNLRMSDDAIKDAEQALAELNGPEMGGDNNLRRLNLSSFVGVRYGHPLVQDWKDMRAFLRREGYRV